MKKFRCFEILLLAVFTIDQVIGTKSKLFGREYIKVEDISSSVDNNGHTDGNHGEASHMSPGSGQGIIHPEIHPPQNELNRETSVSINAENSHNIQQEPKVNLKSIIDSIIEQSISTNAFEPPSSPGLDHLIAEKLHSHNIHQEPEVNLKSIIDSIIEQSISTNAFEPPSSPGLDHLIAEKLRAYIPNSESPQYSAVNDFFNSNHEQEQPLDLRTLKMPSVYEAPTQRKPMDLTNPRPPAFVSQESQNLMFKSSPQQKLMVNKVNLMNLVSKYRNHPKYVMHKIFEELIVVDELSAMRYKNPNGFMTIPKEIREAVEVFVEHIPGSRLSSKKLVNALISHINSLQPAEKLH